MTMQRSGIGSTLDRLVMLFVRDQSIYKAMGLDCYDRHRDARTFAGAGLRCDSSRCCRHRLENYKHTSPEKKEYKAGRMIPSIGPSDGPTFITDDGEIHHYDHDGNFLSKHKIKEEKE